MRVPNCFLLFIPDANSVIGKIIMIIIGDSNDIDNTMMNIL